jgi:hypothetical protein
MNKSIKVVLSLSLSLSVYVPGAFAKLSSAIQPTGQSCQETKKLVENCRKDGWIAGNTSNFSLPGGSYPATQATALQTEQKGRNMQAAADRCKASVQECEEKCKTKEEKQECAGAVAAAATNLQQQSNGLGGDALAMLAAAGLMGAALAASGDKEEETPPMPPPLDSPIDPNTGQVNCGHKDAYMLPVCDSKLADSCLNAIEDNRCRVIAGRLCNASGPVAAAERPKLCDVMAAYDWCKNDPDGAKQQCVSCLHLHKDSTDFCRDNPAQCQHQNSPEVVADMRTGVCADDPAYYGQQPVTVQGPGPGPGGPAPNPALPAPILPSGGASGMVSGGGLPPTGGGIAPPGGGGGTIVTSSLKSAAGGREAFNNNPTGSAEGGGYRPSSASGGGGGGTIMPSGITQRNVASNSTGGPVSDVNGEFGPSLFATSSQVIRNRCAAGRFNNCP